MFGEGIFTKLNVKRKILILLGPFVYYKFVI